MSENKRFKETYKGGYDFVDTLSHKSYSYCDSINLLNQIWNQTQRFEKHNQRLIQENEKLKQQLRDIDSLIYDLGHEEMQRQYEEITDD